MTPDFQLLASLALSLLSACQAAAPESLAESPAVPSTTDEAKSPTSSDAARPIADAADPLLTAPGDEGWAFLVKPYVFASGMSGTVRTGKGAADIDASFNDILDHLELGGMLAFEAALPDSSWAFLIDLVYMNLEDEGMTRGPMAVPVDAEVEQFVGELSAAYEVLDAGRFDVLAGMRYWNLSADLTAHTSGGALAAGLSLDWIDPLLGARTRLPLSKHFDCMLRGDIGGFGVGSQFAANLMGEVGWTMSETFQLALGYRYVYVDYRSNVSYEMGYAGPTLGLEIRF